MWRPTVLSGAARKRRHTVLAEMVEHAERSGDLDAPWETYRAVLEHFRDDGEILRTLHDDWRTALAGAVYVAIEQGQGDLRKDVQTAHDAIRRRYRGVRRLLEHHADHPAIAAAMAKERALMDSFAVLTAAVGGDTQAA